MGFMTGGVTARQFRVDGQPAPFGDDEIERLARFKMGYQKLASADGVETGWGAGDHLFDGDFACEKNLRGDFLKFDLRVDTERLPAELLRAYFAVDLKALSANNPSGFPTARQKREARESARDRLENEAKDGRFKKRSAVPVVWDRGTGRVWFGSASVTHVDRFVALFQQTFGYCLDRVRPAMVADATVGEPTAWVAGVTPEEFAWIDDQAAGDWLGNEFLVWLMTEMAGPKDEIHLPDRGSAVVMFSRTLHLECPRGQTGTAAFGDDRPPRLSEVVRAMRGGKLPRSAGLTVVIDQEQYEFTLKADQWVISGGKVPKPDDEVTDSAQRELARLESVRWLLKSPERLFQAFAAVRRSPGGMTDAVQAFRKWVG